VCLCFSGRVDFSLPDYFESDFLILIIFASAASSLFILLPKVWVQVALLVFLCFP
jgi:hypothetical protein